MAADVDTLNIKIEASADKAVVALSLLQTSLAGAVAALRTLQNVVKDQTKAAAESTKETKKISENVREMGKAASSSSSGFKKLLKSIGRIAFYRAIRTAIKTVTSSLKEGLTNLYTYSQQFGTAFAPAVDNLRQHILLLKNSFATALRPALEALMPVIIQLVDWFSKLADFAAQVLSVLFGKTDENGRYTKAVLGDLQEANEEAKELKRSLLGFDEINRLDGDNGGKKEQNAISTQFVQAEVSEKAKKIADWINGIDWARVASVVIPILEILGILKIASLPGIKQILTLIGKFAVAHPLLTAILAVVISLAIWGDKIQDAVVTFSKKAKKFFTDFKQWLSDIAQKIKDWINTGNDDIDRGLKSWVDMFSGFFQGIVGAINGIVQFVTNVIAAISGFIYKLFHGDIKGAFKDLALFLINALLDLYEIVANIVNAALSIVNGLFNSVINGIAFLWNNVLRPFLNWILEWPYNHIYVPLHNLLIDIKVGILRGVQDLWNGIASKINEALSGSVEKINKFIRWLNGFLGTNLPEIPLEVVPLITDERIEELENTKLDPLEEGVELIPEWTNVPQLNLQVNADTSKLRTEINKMFGVLETNINKASSAVDSLLQKKPTKDVYLARYASGGWVDAGTLMVAGEAGPEVVGNFNGRTGVMNDEQLAAALYNAVSAALANNPQGGDIYLDGEVIYRNTVKRNNNMVRSTGRSALLT